MPVPFLIAIPSATTAVLVTWLLAVGETVQRAKRMHVPAATPPPVPEESLATLVGTSLTQPADRHGASRVSRGRGRGRAGGAATSAGSERRMIFRQAGTGAVLLVALLTAAAAPPDAGAHGIVDRAQVNPVRTSARIWLS